MELNSFEEVLAHELFFSLRTLSHDLHEIVLSEYRLYILKYFIGLFLLKLN